MTHTTEQFLCDVWILYHVVGLINVIVWCIATKSPPLPKHLFLWLPMMCRHNYALFHMALLGYRRDQESRRRRSAAFEQAAKEGRN